jgi:diaminopimelate epimerase
MNTDQTRARGLSQTIETKASYGKIFARQQRIEPLIEQERKPQTKIRSMEISFSKVQAVGNDFLVVEAAELASSGLAEEDLAEFSRTICDRHKGVGADGVEIVDVPEDAAKADASIRLFNSDGSEAEISGNGTRCVAAYLLDRGGHSPLRIATKAGVKALRLIERQGLVFQLEMSMGRPTYRQETAFSLLKTGPAIRELTILDVGNPQVALLVDDFDFDWRALGRAIESHERFPQRTNVSFSRVLDRHRIEVRFWERGAGETMSSGTGSTGAVVAAILSGRVESPVTVVTPAGEMRLRWEDEVLLEGPAQLVAHGRYLSEGSGRSLPH